VFTLTVRWEPVPVTPVTDAPVTPVVVSAKSLVDVPVTASEKLTRKLTLARLVSAPLTRVMFETTGGVLSMV